jgi:hypothetical protein
MLCKTIVEIETYELDKELRINKKCHEIKTHRRVPKKLTSGHFSSVLKPHSASRFAGSKKAVSASFFQNKA